MAKIKAVQYDTNSWRWVDVVQMERWRANRKIYDRALNCEYKCVEIVGKEWELKIWFELIRIKIKEWG